MRCLSLSSLSIAIALAFGLGACASANDPSGLAASEDDLLAVNKKAVWHLDIENPVNLNADADIFDIDLFDNLPAKTTYIKTLKAKGKKVICYFSAGSSESNRQDHASLPASGIGRKMVGWDERWLDHRNAGVRAVMAKRIQLAKQSGCDGVDPDNVDGFTHNTGFSLSAQDQLDYNRFLARTAHSMGLAIGLKNDLEQLPQLLASFDFAVNESCYDNNECDALLPFIRAGKSVLHIEYGDIDTNRSHCAESNRKGLYSILSTENRMDGRFERCSTLSSGNGGVVDEASGGSGGPAAPSGAGCYSTTLKKPMPEKACVQARSNSLWYRCEASSWVETTASDAGCSSKSPL
jgi:hypothetical protein